MDIQNPEKIEIEGLKTIRKLCKFGAGHNMEGCSFTEIVELMFDELSKAKAIPEWIETSERMPNEGEEVLVHHYGHIVQATRDKKYSGGFKQRNCYGWEAVSSYISHWIPKSIQLPESYNFYYENDAKQKAIEAQEQS